MDLSCSESTDGDALPSPSHCYSCASDTSEDSIGVAHAMNDLSYEVCQAALLQKEVYASAIEDVMMNYLPYARFQARSVYEAGVCAGNSG